MLLVDQMRTSLAWWLLEVRSDVGGASMLGACLLDVWPHQLKVCRLGSGLSCVFSLEPWWLKLESISDGQVMLLLLLLLLLSLF